MSERAVAPRARATDPETSREAGERAEEFLAEHHARILGSLMVDGPATIYEIGWRTGLGHVAVARRMSELQRKGVVETTGDTRRGPSGRSARVWRAVR